MAGTGSSIDLNADVGESFGRWQLGDDSALLPLLSSANVACGFHAGDALTLRRTVTEAAEHGVAVGAQVSYRDLAGFGRREMTVEPDELAADVLYQIGALAGLCRTAGTEVRYVKPHGALYHRTLKDRVQAGALVAAVVDYDASLPLMTMAGGEVEKVALAAGVRVVLEGFADRAYDQSGRLVPRSQEGALLTDPAVAAAQAVRLAQSGRVESLCLHGDTPGAPLLARAVRTGLEEAGFAVRAFIAA
jgi:5-oxoprolinase (ATP-hydrolysing) subunit A